MPSAFAHAFVGASIASALPRRTRPAWLVATLALAAAAPDLDVVAFRLDVPYAHPLGHRGWSHSLLLAALVALACRPLWRRTLPVPEYARLASGLTFAAIASHGVLDAFTDAGLGIGLLIPFDMQRYFSPWRPIETSPLSPQAFFSERGLAILANELLWIGLPTLVAALGIAALRRARATDRSRS